MDVKEIINQYYNNHLFVFLPNLCNSACDFCYVDPIIGKSAKLSKNLLNNFEKLIKQAKKNRF